jgi:CRISPR/Cas system-associated exonuclease Cas4 (RecB family)
VSIKNLSVSKIEAYLKCPLAFKYRYVDKVPELTSPVLAAGSAFHAVIEHGLLARSAGRTADPKELDDRFGPAWDGQFREDEQKPGFLGWREDPADPLDRMKEEYRALVRLAATEVLPKICPWHIDGRPVIEHRIDLEVQSAEGPFPVVGYIDLLGHDGLLIDWKTTRDTEDQGGKDEEYKRKKNARGWLQFAAYSCFTWPLTGQENQPARKIFMVRGPKPRVEHFDYVVTQAHREWFMRVAGDVWTAIKRDVYPPDNTGWWCDERFCSFYGPCQEGLHACAVQKS